MAKDLPTPLPCPFCGSTPQTWSKNGVDFIGCKQKGCSAHPKVGTTAGHTLAITYWNTRMPPADLTQSRKDAKPGEAIERDTMNDAGD